MRSYVGKNGIPFTGELNGRCFEHIKASHSLGYVDFSYTATFRALLYDRVAKEAEEEAYMFIEDFSQIRLSESLTAEDSRGNISTLRVFIIPCSVDFNELLLTTGLPSERWVKEDKVSIFFQKKAKSVCFINKKIKTSILLVQTDSDSVLRCTQVAIPVALPWLFSKPLDEDEMELLDSINSNNLSKYKSSLSKIESKSGIREKIIEEALGGLEERLQEVELRRLKDQAAILNSENRRILLNISRNLEKIRELEIRIAGIEIVGSKDDNASELRDYFTLNKSIILESLSSNGDVRFFVADYATYFDEELAGKVIENNSSYLRNAEGSLEQRGVLYKDFRSLMRMVFVERKIKLKIFAHFVVSIPNMTIDAITHQYEDSLLSTTHHPNTHLTHHACLGQHAAAIADSLNNRNLIGAIEQCVAATKNINFGDSVVVKRIILDLICSRNKVLEFPDGTLANFEDAIKMIKGKEGV